MALLDVQPYLLMFLIIEKKKKKTILWQCDPYFDQTGCSHPGCEPGYPTPKCVRKCVKGNQLWRQSKHYSVNAYRVHSDPQNIMTEVYKNGPVEVSFTVYEVKKCPYLMLLPLTLQLQQIFQCRFLYC